MTASATDSAGVADADAREGRLARQRGRGFLGGLALGLALGAGAAATLALLNPLATEPPAVDAAALVAPGGPDVPAARPRPAPPQAPDILVAGDRPAPLVDLGGQPEDRPALPDPAPPRPGGGEPSLFPGLQGLR